ncbi:hypothetical protein [Nocardioides sp. SYSU D00038]|uniref:hypothetical protein n=1 Tax=Nocardioides sp. SYSU D00038 TaxID=2812554 RepID=UPI0019680765|nr:hypothetical protein [Nocardioides sp. SYSU D00038]
MSTVLIIAGLALVALGAVVFLLPTSKPDDDAVGAAVDIGKVLEQLASLMEKLDKRYRPGFVLMLVGLALVAAGIYLETHDVKEKTDDAAVVQLR